MSPGWLWLGGIVLVSGVGERGIPSRSIDYDFKAVGEFSGCYPGLLFLLLFLRWLVMLLAIAVGRNQCPREVQHEF